MSACIPKDYHEVRCCFNCIHYKANTWNVEELVEDGSYCSVVDDEAMPWGLCDDYAPSPYIPIMNNPDNRTYFTVLEQHNDGAWWYHPRWSFDNFDQAADYAVDFSARHENRPVTVIEHTGELPARSCCTRKTSYGLAAIDFAGGILARINILNNFKI